MRVKKPQPFNPEKQYSPGERSVYRGMVIIAKEWKCQFILRCNLCVIKQEDCFGSGCVCDEYHRADKKRIYFKKLYDIKQKALEYNKKEKAKADESYITENCPFKIGDRVKQDSNVGTIEEIRVDNNGKFEYTIRKEKKDGTPSKNVFRTFSWYRNNVEKA